MKRSDEWGHYAFTRSVGLCLRASHNVEPKELCGQGVTPPFSGPPLPHPIRAMLQGLAPVRIGREAWRYLSIASIAPQGHVNSSWSPKSAREAFVQVLGLSAHDAYQEGSFTRFEASRAWLRNVGEQSLVHSADLAALWQICHTVKTLHNKLIHSAKLLRE